MSATMSAMEPMAEVNPGDTLWPAVFAMGPCGHQCSRADLIGSHETAVALNVSRKDSGQAARRFDGFGQG